MPLSYEAETNEQILTFFHSSQDGIGRRQGELLRYLNERSVLNEVNITTALQQINALSERDKSVDLSKFLIQESLYLLQKEAYADHIFSDQGIKLIQQISKIAEIKRHPDYQSLVSACLVYVSKILYPTTKYALIRTLEKHGIGVGELIAILFNSLPPLLPDLKVHDYVEYSTILLDGKPQTYCDCIFNLINLVDTLLPHRRFDDSALVTIMGNLPKLLKPADLVLRSRSIKNIFTAVLSRIRYLKNIELGLVFNATPKLLFINLEEYKQISAISLMEQRPFINALVQRAEEVLQAKEERNKFDGESISHITNSLWKLFNWSELTQHAAFIDRLLQRAAQLLRVLSPQSAVNILDAMPKLAPLERINRQHDYLKRNLLQVVSQFVAHGQIQAISLVGSIILNLGKMLKSEAEVSECLPLIPQLIELYQAKQTDLTPSDLMVLTVAINVLKQQHCLVYYGQFIQQLLSRAVILLREPTPQFKLIEITNPLRLIKLLPKRIRNNYDNLVQQVFNYICRFISPQTDISFIAEVIHLLGGKELPIELSLHSELIDKLLGFLNQPQQQNDLFRQSQSHKVFSKIMAGVPDILTNSTRDLTPHKALMENLLLNAEYYFGESDGELSFSSLKEALTISYGVPLLMLALANIYESIPDSSQSPFVGPRGKIEHPYLRFYNLIRTAFEQLISFSGDRVEGETSQIWIVGHACLCFYNPEFLQTCRSNPYAAAFLGPQQESAIQHFIGQVQRVLANLDTRQIKNDIEEFLVSENHYYHLICPFLPVDMVIERNVTQLNGKKIAYELDVRGVWCGRTLNIELDSHYHYIRRDGTAYLCLADQLRDLILSYVGRGEQLEIVRFSYSDIKAHQRAGDMQQRAGDMQQYINSRLENFYSRG